TLDDEHVVMGLLCGLPRWLLGVQLYDELLAHLGVDLLPQGEREHADGAAAVLDLQPRGRPSIDGVEIVTDDDELACLLAQLDAVVLTHAVAGDGHSSSVHAHVAVAHELTCLVPARP